MQARCATTIALPGGGGAGAGAPGDRELVGRMLARFYSVDDPVYQKVQRGVVAALRLLLLEKVVSSGACAGSQALPRAAALHEARWHECVGRGARQGPSRPPALHGQPEDVFSLTNLSCSSDRLALSDRGVGGLYLEKLIGPASPPSSSPRAGKG